MSYIIIWESPVMPYVLLKAIASLGVFSCKGLPGNITVFLCRRKGKRPVKVILYFLNAFNDFKLKLLTNGRGVLRQDFQKFGRTGPGTVKRSCNLLNQGKKLVDQEQVTVPRFFCHHVSAC